MSLPTPTYPPSRRPSRSNSVSSSVTIKKSASLSIKSGSRSSYLRGRSTSPDSISRVLHSLNNSRQDLRSRPESQEHNKSAASFNLNRWSHSTSSSTSGLDSDLIRKRTSSSGATRRSIAGYSLNGNNHVPPESLNNKAATRKTHLKRSLIGSTSLEGSRLNFQDSSNLNVVRDSSQSSSAMASSEFFTPSWEHRTGVNKFGESVQGLSIQYTEESASLLNGASHVNGRLSPTRPGHRDRSANLSKDISKHSMSSLKSDNSRSKGHRSPKQKDMLSKALAKANTAVLLDNGQNISGAIEAYNEACELLEQVMVRSSDEEDRRKLSSIQLTYSNRIAELHDLDDSFADILDKPLPEDPPSDEYDHPEEYYQEDSSLHSKTSKDLIPTLELPLRQESLLPQLFGGDQYLQDPSVPSVRDPTFNGQLNVPMDTQYMPPPLSPRHPPLSEATEDNSTPTATATAADATRLEPPAPSSLDQSAGSTSWLDNLDESSSKSSSRLSSIDFERQNGQLVSEIQAEFDAAMNAAVDSAYDDEQSQERTPRTADSLVNVLHEDYVGSQNEVIYNTNNAFRTVARVDQEVLDLEAEEEERLLDEMTREFGMEEPGYNSPNKPSLPRQSDSSGYSSRTWGSSVASTTATSGTTLSTLAEGVEPLSAVLPPPAKSPPQVPAVVISRRSSQASRPQSSDKHVPIRDRRMSGQSAKQLKIDTFARRASISQSERAQTIPAPTIEEPRDESQQETINNFSGFHSSISGTQPLTPLASVASGDSFHGESPATPALTQGGSIDENSNAPTSPTRLGKMMPPPPPVMRKNLSSSNLKKGVLSINTSTDLLEAPMTPGSMSFSADARRQPPTAITPGGSIMTSGIAGGMYLFDDHAGLPHTPQVDNPNPDELGSLEPCPDSFLLRPFWLMRCLYQALSQPHGGYVTQRLFLSRDIWRVRNVKIKALEDKISTCDLLTAALQKLARVDTLDASAVLEEVQAFETILDQVRGTLSKKLGSEVGLTGSAAVFKNSPAGDEASEAMPVKSANASSAAKSIASGWRKLRSKSSTANLSTIGSTRDAGTFNFTMTTLPMTASSSVATSRSHLNRARNPPPTPSQLTNVIAPHAVYMSSLARLFDAVQILDSIARQVEDPGLRCSSQTHVGLELSVRNAAEFFAFYIIRFVMNDLLMLVDKFLKRGSEWVMT